MADAEAIELGVAYLSIVGETDKLARSVKDGMREAQRYADRNPINIKADIDVSHIGAVEIPVLSDTSRFSAGVERAIRDAQAHATAHPIDIRANIDVSRSGSVMVDVIPDFARFGTRMDVGLALAQAQHDWSVSVGVDINSASALAQMQALHAQLEAAATPITQNVNVDVDRDGINQIRSIGGSLGGLGLAAGGTAAVAAGIAAIGGAAGAAVGAVGLLGAGLASLGPAAAAGISTIAVGLQGVGDAFKALSAAEDSAAKDGEAQAKAIASAQDQLKTAYEGVEDAQRSLADAQKDARDATKDIADAYKDAREELEDYNFAVKDAALSEAEAKQSLIEAREEFAKAPPEDRAKAYLRLQRADLRYQQAVEKNKDTQAEANEALAKGVEGSDKVVAAKDRAAQANRRVEDAERAVSRANDQVAKAQQAVTDAMSKTSAAQDKAAQAMAKLSPATQAWVLATRGLGDEWEDLTHSVQDALFADAADGITELANAALPTLKAGMVDVASSMNGLTKQFAAFWAAPENLSAVQSIFKGTADFIDGMGPGLQQATTGFLSLGQAFEPVANQVGAQLGGMLGQIGQAFTDAFQSGALTELIGNFGNVLESLGKGLNPLLDGLIEAGNIIAPTLGPFLEQLGTSLGAIAPSLATLGGTFLSTLTTIMPSLESFIIALSDGLGPVVPVLGTLLQSLMTALTPLIGPMSQIAQVVGTALSDAFIALAPAMGPIGDAFASLVTAVSPIIPTIATVVSGLVQALAPALTTIFDALGPVIKQWADLMIPVFEEIQPILAEVAGEIGTAIADALNQIAPLLPDIAKSFSGLLLAIVPLLPELVRLGTELLPPLIDLMTEMAPITLGIIDGFTWLVNNVLVPLLIPALQQMSDNFTLAIDTATSVVRGAKDFLSGALEDIGSYFTGLGSTVSTVWDTIMKTIRFAVRKIGEFLVDLPRIEIPDLPGIPGRGTEVGFGGIGQSMVNWGSQGMKDGGLFRGVGTRTSDSNLVALSDHEFVVNADSTAKNLPLLEAINSGWVPSADFLHALVPGFKDGGLVAGKKFAQSMDSADYLMGGFSRSAIDCSAMVSAVVNDALGLDPFDSRMSTVNEGEWLSAKGALPGMGGPGDISIGWFDNGGGANGHTALTLGDGTNVESRGGDGVVIGTSAAGADDPMFDQHMHIPEKLLRGGDLGAGVTGKGLGPSMTGGGKAGSGTSGGGMKKSRQSAGGASGGSGGAGESDAAAETDFGMSGVTDVFVTNWPSNLGGLATGGPAGEGLPLTYGADPAVPATTYSPDTSTPYVAPAAPSATPTPDSSTHPLASLPLPGAAADLFQGPAPWYMAATPEQALANLGSQAAGMAQRTIGDVQGFFQDNWKEMAQTGLAVAGMGAMGGGGNTTYNISGTDPMSAAAAVDRVHRRRSLATQRSGGFGR